MAKSKKYYWLKLKEDFFEEDTIQWLEEQENGKEYCLFYLKLCLKSLKTNGILIRNVGQMLVPYDVKKLADITNVRQDTVIVAMEIFKKIGLVQILDNGEIYMSQLDNMVGSETNWAQYKRKDKVKNGELEKLQSNSNMIPKKLQAEIENRDKEIETTTIDIEKIFSGSGDEINFEDLKLYLLENKFTKATDKNIKEIIKEFPAWWIKEAIEIAVFSTNFNLAYVYGILRNWVKDGKTKEKCKVQENNSKKEKIDSFNNFEQRKYSASEISEIEKDLLGWNSNEEEMKE